jgi:cell division protein FtsZ
VIATGFRQESPARRERMLAGTTLPTLQHEPPRISQRPLTSNPIFREEDVTGPAVTTSGSVLPSVPLHPSEQVRSVGIPAASSATRLSQMLDSVSESSIAAPTRTGDALEKFPGFRETAKRAPVYQEWHEGAAEAAKKTGAGAYAPPAISEVRQELVPVKASVFDDDFFKKPNDELRAAAPESGTQWPEAKIPSFAGYLSPDETGKDEDLDIPAFMRRNP